MPRDCCITVTEDAERVAKFQEIFGTTTLCIASPKTTIVAIEGRDWPCYYLDLSLLQPDQRNALVAHLAQSKQLTIPDAETHLWKYGYWVVSEGTRLTTAMRLFD